MALALVLDPTASKPSETARRRTPTPNRELAGLRIGVRIDEHWQSWTLISSAWRAKFEAAGASVSVFRSGPRIGKAGADAERERDLLFANSDLIISGLCNCGGCTMQTVRDGVAALDRGLPAVVISSGHFVGLARELAAASGWPTLEIFELPFPLEGLTQTELAAIAEQRYPDVLTSIGVRTQ
jgi:hypothetical protein